MSGKKSKHQELMQVCNIQEEKEKPVSFQLVIFGGAGDLALKKLLPTLYSLFKMKRFSDDFSVLAFGHLSKTKNEFRALVQDSIQENQEGSFCSSLCGKFISHLDYIAGDFKDTDVYREMWNRLKNPKPSPEKSLIFYFAVHPEYTPLIVTRLGESGKQLSEFEIKVIIEKPFGTDFSTARSYNRTIRKVFREDQIYRIDHYLGKETVQNIIFSRFGNTIFEPVWNRDYIEQVQITVAETAGVGTRGAYFDKVGIIRDMVQNHVLQLVSLVAMEPLVSFQADSVRDEKVKVYRSLRPVTGKQIALNTVFGQYSSGKMDGKKVKAYRQENRVKKNSFTPTYFAGRFFIDNWRWAGVPFYIRTGKRLSGRSTRISVHFRKPPVQFFGKDCMDQRSNMLVFGIQPDEEILVRFGVKYPGHQNKVFPVNMNFNYKKTFKESGRPPYGRLLMDCIKGDLTLFARMDGIEAMWSVVDPLVSWYEKKKDPPLEFYEAGSDGPFKALNLPVQEGFLWESG